jgi:hypothetical protein
MSYKLCQVLWNRSGQAVDLAARALLAPSSSLFQEWSHSSYQVTQNLWGSYWNKEDRYFSEGLQAVRGALGGHFGYHTARICLKIKTTRKTESEDRREGISSM